MQNSCGLHSGTVLKRIIIITDLLFLASLLYLGFCWWEVKTTLTFLGHTFTIKWQDTLYLLPVITLAIHGMAASTLEAQDRNCRMGLFRSKWTGRFVLLFISIMAPIMITDALLKKTNIDIHVAPIVLDNHQGHDKEYFGSSRQMIKDPDLIWTFNPHAHVYGRDLNSLGFREREVNPLKAPGVRRIICLGDSVTAQGQPGYSQYLHELLTNAPPDGGKWEAFNMGVYGYSALQGLRLFQLRVKELKPDIVTVSFGRNDHTTLEHADNERMVAHLSTFARHIYSVLTRRTVGRVILHIVDRNHLLTVTRTKEQKGEGLVIRVPPEEYREVLRLFVKEIRDIGAVPILLTAPRKSIIPDDYVNNKRQNSTAEYIQLHDQYSQITREVCRETGALLVDMQRIITGPEWDPHFAHDAIHLDEYGHETQMTLYSKEQPGLRRFAKALYDKIAEMNPPAQK